jgi:hypothetical protein
LIRPVRFYGREKPDLGSNPAANLPASPKPVPHGAPELEMRERAPWGEGQFSVTRSVTVDSVGNKNAGAHDAEECSDSFKHDL